MSYGGHVLDMINRIKQNRELKEKLREKYDRLSESQKDTVYNKSIYKLKPERKLSEKELEQIREQTKQKNRIQSIYQALAILIALIIITLLLIMIN